MSKLIDWLTGGGAILSIWLALFYNLIGLQIVEEYRTSVTAFPFIVFFCLASYAAVVVFWRVYNFNDCQKEVSELQKEVKEARADLISKGFVF